MSQDRTGPPPVTELIAVTTSRSESGARVHVAGEVDCSTAPRLTESLDGVLDDAPAEVVVDLTEVTFLDSAGLHALVTAHGRAGRAGTRLRVLVATRAVLRPIQVTGLAEVLAVEQVAPGAGAGAA
ncbi:STAS domain-containing protein [Blastococcus sp. SYSU D00695]